MNPLHLEILTDTRVADTRRLADRVWLEHVARAAAKPASDDDGQAQPRMPRGPRLRVRPPVLARGLRTVRVLFGGALA